MITLSGNNVIYTNRPDTDFRVESGKVLLYLIVFHEGRGVINHLVGTCNKGSIIPHFFTQVEKEGKKFDICFKLKTQSTAQIEEVPHEKKHAANFLSRLGVDSEEYADGDSDEFLVQFVLQKMYLKIDEDNEVISRNIKHSEEIRKNQLVKFAIQFAHPREQWREKIPSSISPLYNAMTLVCRMCGMPTADYNRLTENYGMDFAPEDYARTAGFICREIAPHDNWKKDDIGPLLILEGDESHPVVCCFKRGRVRYWDAVNDESGILKKYKEPEEPIKIYSLVKPLPAGIVKWKDILKLSLAQFRVADAVTLILATLLASAASLMGANLSSVLYGVVIPYGNTGALGSIAWFVLAWVFASMIFTVTKSLTTFRMSSRAQYAIQGALYDRLFHLETSYFMGKESAQVAYRTENLSTCYSGIYSAVINILMMLISIGIYIQKMQSYSADLTGVTLIFVLAGVLCTVVFGYFTQKNQMKSSRLTATMRSFLFQAFGGIQTIRATSSADIFQNRYTDYYNEYSAIYFKKSKLQRFTTFFVSGLSFAAIVAAYYLMSGKSLGISTSAFLAFLSASSAFTGAMTAMAGDVLRIFIMYPMLKDGSEILNVNTENYGGGEVVKEFKGELDFRGVFFRYSKGDSPWVLQNINLHIEPGEYIGIVGPSGCGKSTLFRLILGFEKPEKGSILFDHKELYKLDKVSLRRNIGTVLQDGVLFSGSIYKNLCISKPKATYEEAAEAANLACIAEDIDKMPLGFATPVSEEAETISGGQKQRLMLARAILGKPKMILLDEATSALDNVNQAKVEKNLQDLNCTRIAIAHRLSTVRNCDRILVMDKGTIKEQGTFDELMEQKGLFYQLAENQLM